MQFIGSEVEVRLYQPLEGRKAYVGELAAYEDGAVTVRCPDAVRTFPAKSVAQVRLHVSI